ncbi:unnamed protein product [Schistosoma margrebowiei]|uniref:Uncharacterized protein n=1 Tax=Schistosoma margrebowiei TaxID=48269 RepID=A0A3P8C0N2_9TREM|nr:unnamed protein product [Schistosoma margrebowiei]
MLNSYLFFLGKFWEYPSLERLELNISRLTELLPNYMYYSHFHK